MEARRGSRVKSHAARRRVAWESVASRMRAGERLQATRQRPARDALIYCYFTGETLSIPKTAQIALDCIRPSIYKFKTRQASYACKFVNNSRSSQLIVSCSCSYQLTPICYAVYITDCPKKTLYHKPSRSARAFKIKRFIPRLRHYLSSVCCHGNQFLFRFEIGVVGRGVEESCYAKSGNSAFLTSKCYIVHHSIVCRNKLSFFVNLVTASYNPAVHLVGMRSVNFSIAAHLLRKFRILCIICRRLRLIRADE